MTEHDVAELLPFYANGTLSAADRARVERELAACPSCARELRELETLAAALRARAEAAPPLSGRALDAALERIASGPPSAVTTLRTAWWGVPARYATAAVLVVGLGAAAVAAYHAHEADVARDSRGAQVAAANRTTTIFRVGRAASAIPATVAQAEPPPALAKQHRLARKAHLELLVRDVESSLRTAQATVRSAGGDVTSFADATPRSADDVHGATLEAEVPADRLDGTLDQLAALGAVQNRSVDAEDVAGAIVDEEARLRNLRREESDLRGLMDKGGKVEDVLDVQQHLGDVRGQIEQLDAQHQHDVHRVATSTISLALTEDRPNGAPAKPGPTARIDGAWHSGLSALGDAVVSLIATIAWCVAVAPLALPAVALGYAAVRIARRRRVNAA
ncbi:MAG TPA: DUF4349 domain-containing protein [Candidatus Elarobacter sp.]|nr:DUF4349 domain-containing protein [Candidatus Elarobacter sp.]